MTDRCTGVLLALRDVIEQELVATRRAAGGRPLSLIDIGCWDGEATVRYQEALGGTARGVEVFADKAVAARSRGIAVAEVDLETQPLPWPDASADVVIANQVFEHLKNIWLPMSEIARVLAPGGTLIFSVPNLASLHNRVLLALGRQPTSIRTFGPHVRGFTWRQAREFLVLGDFLAIDRIRGVGFYGLGRPVATLMARLWTSASHTPVFRARRLAPLCAPIPWTAGAEAEATYYGR